MTPELCAQLWTKNIFVFFTRKTCSVRFAKISILRWDLGRSSGLPWRPCFATFSLLAPKSLVGTRQNVFRTKKLYFLKEYVVSRFSKDMHSQLGSGWCRRALRDAPR